MVFLFILALSYSHYCKRKANYMLEKIKASLLGYGRFSEEDLLLITNRLTVVNYKKQSCLIKEGQICKELCFVNNGGFKQYVVSDDGTEAITNLFTADDWMLEYKSFTSQKPSETFIEATEESELLVLSIHNLHELIKLSDSFFSLGRILELATQNQQYQNNRKTPEEKYALLLANKPQVIQMFPAKDIASFLGMAPETLSRVRRKLIS
jgi:CRP-like cAMP-binding protein